MSILYSNTVEPRIAELQTRGALILCHGNPAASNEDFPIVVRASDNVSDGILRIRRMRARAGLEARDEESERLIDDLRKSAGLAAKYLSDHYKHKVMAVRSSRVPTTFGRISRSESLGLIVHGYASTMLALSYTFGAPSGRLKMDRFERLLALQIGDEPGFQNAAEQERL
jgi:hypothetical protein